MKKSDSQTTDPVEKAFAAFCKEAGVEVIPHDHISGLDFYLPEHDVYVECKRFHSERISEQMSRKANVIAIQGLVSAKCLSRILEKAKGDKT